MFKYIISKDSVDEIETGDAVEVMTLTEFKQYMKDAIQQSQIKGTQKLMAHRYTLDDFSPENLNNQNYELNITTTIAFRNGIKMLVKNHKNKTLEKLLKIISDLANFKVSTQYKNHKLKDTDLHDIHVEGDVILLYRYIGDAVLVSLELSDVTNHDSLKTELNHLK